MICSLLVNEFFMTYYLFRTCSQLVHTSWLVTSTCLSLAKLSPSLFLFFVTYSSNNINNIFYSIYHNITRIPIKDVMWLVKNFNSITQRMENYKIFEYYVSSNTSLEHSQYRIFVAKLSSSWQFQCHSSWTETSPIIIV